MTESSVIESSMMESIVHHMYNWSVGVLDTHMYILDLVLHYLAPTTTEVILLVLLLLLVLHYSATAQSDQDCGGVKQFTFS